MPRTIPRRNASAVIAKRSSAPSAHHSARLTVRVPPGPAAKAEAPKKAGATKRTTTKKKTAKGAAT